MTNLALKNALEKTVAARKAVDAAIINLDNEAINLALISAPLGDAEINASIIGYEKGRKNLGLSLAQMDKNAAAWHAEALPYVEPPPPPPPTTVYGCPASKVLVPWNFKPVEGAGRPTKPGEGPYSIIPNWKEGAHLTGFRFQGDPGDNYYAGSNGIAGPGQSRNIRVTQAVIDRANKWHGNIPECVSVHLSEVTDLNGTEEHDWYPHVVANGFSRDENRAAYVAALASQGVDMTKVSFMLERCLSRRSGSQRLQVAQRDRDGLTPVQMGETGMIWIKHDMCVDHARHGSEGGTGTRPSQAYKIFSSQIGPEGSAKDVLLKAYFLLEGIILDDSMQQFSFGALLLGACLGGTVRNCSFRGGSLNHPNEKTEEAVRIPAATGLGAGPLIIDDIEMFYGKGDAVTGFNIFDLTRPIEIKGCAGNMLIKGPQGQILSHIKDGYKQGM